MALISHQIEAIQPREMYNYLRSLGAHPVRQRGSHVTMRLVSGKEVPLPDPGGNGRHPLTTLVAKRIANGLGLTLRELRAEFGIAAQSRRATRNGAPSEIAPRLPAAVDLTQRAQVRSIMAALEKLISDGIAPSRHHLLSNNLPALLRVTTQLASGDKYVA